MRESHTWDCLGKATCRFCLFFRAVRMGKRRVHLGLALPSAALCYSRTPAALLHRTNSQPATRRRGSATRHGDYDPTWCSTEMASQPRGRESHFPWDSDFPFIPDHASRRRIKNRQRRTSYKGSYTSESCLPSVLPALRMQGSKQTLKPEPWSWVPWVCVPSPTF